MTKKSPILTTSVENKNGKSSIVQNAFFYGWVIVAACAILQALTYGIQYSFGIFFKPLIADFGWSRATISGVYSLSLICGGILAVPVGWLADKFSPAKVAVLCGFLTGLGLILTSQISELWQLFLTFGVIVGIGTSGAFVIGTGITARWFVKKRGFALGIVAAGIGVGTLVVSPIAERLIATFGWSSSYFILGLAAWAFMIPSALLLRRDPKDKGCMPYGVERTLPEINQSDEKIITKDSSATSITYLLTTVYGRPMWMLIFSYFFLSICAQLVIVHLANYTTDLGIAPFIAATVISVIGIGSIAGRLLMGTASDRIGSNNALIICCSILTISLILLIFASQSWMLYLFAAIFSFAYGGEVPLIPALIGQFYGIRSVSTFVGVIIFVTRVGGAVGSWIGGQIFDLTQSYVVAFIIAAILALFAVVSATLLKKTS